MHHTSPLLRDSQALRLSVAWGETSTEATEAKPSQQMQWPALQRQLMNILHGLRKGRQVPVRKLPQRFAYPRVRTPGSGAYVLQLNVSLCYESDVHNNEFLTACQS